MYKKIYLFLYYTCLYSLNIFTAYSNTSYEKPAFNLQMNLNLPYLTKIHTYSCDQESTLNITYYLTTSSLATKEDLRDDLFSQKRRNIFQCRCLQKNPTMSHEAIQEAFIKRQKAALEQATDPKNFATLEPFAKAAVSHIFKGQSTVEVCFDLASNHTAFIRNITLHKSQVFDQSNPTIQFDAHSQTLTQTFKIKHKQST